LVTDEEEGGFIDLDFRLLRLDVKSNGVVVAIGKGRHGGRVVGFAIELNPEWNAQPIENADSFLFWGSGVVPSIGAERDTILAMLSDLYGVPLDSGMMRSEIKVSIVGLGDDPRCVSEKPTHMKLFFEADPDHYAEVFVNVIASEGRLEFHEKDPEYRKPLIRALSI
jgi:hypothetical protein